MWANALKLAKTFLALRNSHKEEGVHVLFYEDVMTIYCRHFVDMRERIAIILLLLLLAYFCLGRKASHFFFFFVFCMRIIFILKKKDEYILLLPLNIPPELNPSYICSTIQQILIPESLCSLRLTEFHFLGSPLLVHSRLWLFLFPMSTQSYVIIFFQKFIDISLHWFPLSYFFFLSWLWVYFFLYIYTLEGTQVNICA